ncbi:MAG: hypothetical protein M3N98_05755, partial [Actinomycetota bacterium]|nr:hypothetical protein [Actinomycetota bacterium]
MADSLWRKRRLESSACSNNRDEREKSVRSTPAAPAPGTTITRRPGEAGAGELHVDHWPRVRPADHG